MTLLLLLMFLVPANQSDNGDWERYKDDYKKIVLAYSRADGISYKVAYSNFPIQSNDKPDSSTSIRYWYQGDKFYYSMGYGEVLKNEKYYIYVDKRTKTIALNRAENINMDFLPVQKVDSALMHGNAKLSYSESKNEGVYKIDIKDPKQLYSRIEMRFDRQTYLITGISMYFAPEKWKFIYGNGKVLQRKVENPRIEYVFSNYSQGPIDRSIFDTSRFLNISGGKISPVEAFQKFNVVNYFIRR
jgi:hypothetical protein